MFLVVLALAIPLALSAPIQYRYGNLLAELRHWAYLITGFSLGVLGWIPITLWMSFVASNKITTALSPARAASVPALPLAFPTLPLTFPTLPLAVPTLPLEIERFQLTPLSALRL